ncbi:hypothetical protein [Halostella salina]|uniref:hypothetical protein n=1 Tax=Halostella salina TaxID=1547897 RepID=UPI000EF829BA|nr:hypothetical protein [Halostella salina]
MHVLGEQQGKAVTDEAEPESADRGEKSGVSVRRRRLLRTGVNLGASAAIVAGFGADYVASRDLDTITYAMARPGPGSATLEPRTKEVPVAWHEGLRLAFEAQERIKQTGAQSLVGSFVVPGSYDSPAATLAVDATDESVADTLADLTGEVPIAMNLVDELPAEPEGTFDRSDVYQVPDLPDGRVPGGVACETDAGVGTLTPALYDADGARFFGTSNHVFGGGGTMTTEHRGEPLAVLHADGPRAVGSVARGYPTADLVRVAPDDGFRPQSAVERASPRRVVGQYTKFGLADLMARGEPLTKVGSVSDRTTGRVEGINGVTCYTGTSCKLGQLKWGGQNDIVDGDSGSVNFHVDPEHPDEGVLVGGLNNARTWWPRADFSWGTAAHHLLDEYGFHF